MAGQFVNGCFLAGPESNFGSMYIVRGQCEHYVDEAKNALHEKKEFDSFNYQKYHKISNSSSCRGTGV